MKRLYSVGSDAIMNNLQDIKKEIKAVCRERDITETQLNGFLLKNLSYKEDKKTSSLGQDIYDNKHLDPHGCSLELALLLMNLGTQGIGKEVYRY